jgi:hypothetical protein
MMVKLSCPEAGYSRQPDTKKTGNGESIPFRFLFSASMALSSV